jgi:UDP-glucose:glycoprotein glucosyltransferase
MIYRSYTRPQLLTFDHVYPPLARALESPPRTAIFYASLSSPNFRELHSYLLSLAKKPVPQIEYVFRHIPPQSRDNTTRNHLSGYGVTLDLKKTDYLAIDDRNAQTNGIFHVTYVIRFFNELYKLGVKKDASKDNEELDVDVDPILTLIHLHPENATAPSAKTPLTEVEIEGM